MVAALTLTRQSDRRLRRRPALLAFAVGAVNVRVDVFLADLTGHGFVVGGRLLSKTDALGGHDILFNHGALLVQNHLVLLLADVRPGLDGTDIGVGNRFALHTDLFVADRHGLGHVLGHDVLAQPSPAAFTLLRADPKPLLRDGHCFVGRGAGRMPLLVRS